MSVQQFCLRWNNHQPNFISVCSSLLHNGTLVDVTLAAEGRQLQAHKIVLSACSSYFQTLFTTNPCQHPIVILKDVQYDDLKTMVDFMYYGEVNVSQEQLPHILKTAEMLKIKGLAEMPTDPANLTKSESKSSEPTELIGAGGNGQGGNGGIGTGSGGGGSSSGGLGSSTGGSVSDSLWGSAESQFQTHHQQQMQQQQQQQQQQQHGHHQQQQNSQAQTSSQQHHQLRRTPSPMGAGASPATRRKRLRKSSNNGSGDRNNSDEQHNTALDTTNSAGGISLSQINQISFATGAGAGSLGGLTSHTLHTAKLLKETSSGDLEQHPQDSDSLEDAHGHVHMQIKPEVDLSGVQQSIPLDISGATTPSEHDAPNSQSSHSDTAIPMMTSSSSSGGGSVEYPVDASTRSSGHHSLQPQPQPQMGSKRNRVLTRQPRVKRDSDSLSNNQISPDATNPLEVDQFSSASAGTSAMTSATLGSGGGGGGGGGGSQPHALYHPHHHYHHHHHHHQRHMLQIPPRIERHSSEPAPSTTPSSPHLLSVPSSTPFLVKQHSDPLLPSQHSLSGVGGGSNPFAPFHRQYSHPLPGNGGGGGGGGGGIGPGSHHHVPTAPLHHPHHISLPESIYASGSPPPAGSSQYVVPQQQHQALSTSLGSGVSVCRERETIVATSTSVPASASTSSATATATKATTASGSGSGAGTDATTSPTKSLSLPQFTTTYVGDSNRSSSSLSVEASGEPVARLVSSSKLRTSKSASASTSASASAGLLVPERGGGLHAGSTGAQASSSFEHLPTLRVKGEELQRSVSSPQTSREIYTLENPRSSHCPAIRPGPALGCNFCWNTIDGHGRILRRKTKYHCPECQTNLCIVPCFQEYHERMNNEANSASTTNPAAAANPEQNVKTANSTTGTGGVVSGSSGAGSGAGAGTGADNTSAADGVGIGAGAGTSSSGTVRHYTKTESI